MKNILLTACNSKFFNSCLTMIASMHRTSPDAVHEILVYNLGLSSAEKAFLNKLAKVRTMEFPEYVGDFYPGYLEPKQYAWKMCCIKEGGNYGDQVFWLDSGIVCLRNMQEIYDEIEQFDIFLVDNKYWLIKNHLSPACARVMQVTDEEKEAPMISGGIQGYKVNGYYQEYVDEGFSWSQIQEAVHGPFECHRHDQTVYSVLAHRYGLSENLHDVFVYGNWTRIDAVPNQFFYVHRGFYHNTKGLITKV
jgi:hypothetical protein